MSTTPPVCEVEKPACKLNLPPPAPHRLLHPGAPELRPLGQDLRAAAGAAVVQQTPEHTGPRRPGWETAGRRLLTGPRSQALL